MAKVSEKIRTALTTSNIAVGWGVGKRIAAQFTKQGIEVLGSGQFGAVIRDNGNVVKIFNAQEKGYGFYLNFLKGKSSVLHPRVKTVGTFGQFTCVQIEPLVDFSKIAGSDVANQLAEWISYKCYATQYRIRGSKYPYKSRFPEAASQYVNQTNLAGMLDKFVRAIVKYEQETDVGLTLDIHAGNFMLRDNGDGTYQFVLTDPLC